MISLSFIVSISVTNNFLSFIKLEIMAPDIARHAPVGTLLHNTYSKSIVQQRQDNMKEHNNRIDNVYFFFSHATISELCFC